MAKSIQIGTNDAVKAYAQFLLHKIGKEELKRRFEAEGLRIEVETEAAVKDIVERKMKNKS